VGGGAVTVVMNGQQEVRSVTIDPEAVDPDEVDMLQDLIMAAMNEALKQSRELAEKKLAPLTGALNIPGLM
jgi:DNA-binding YbaB/EbfC family protein